MQPLNTVTQLQHAIVARRKKLKLSQTTGIDYFGVMPASKADHLEMSAALLLH